MKTVALPNQRTRGHRAPLGAAFPSGGAKRAGERERERQSPCPEERKRQSSSPEEEEAEEAEEEEEGEEEEEAEEERDQRKNLLQRDPENRRRDQENESVIVRPQADRVSTPQSVRHVLVNPRESSYFCLS